jgi:hypothetical protein
VRLIPSPASDKVPRPVALAGDNRAAERPQWRLDERGAGGEGPNLRLCALHPDWHSKLAGTRSGPKVPTNGEGEASTRGGRPPMSFEYLVDRLSGVLYRVVGAGNNGMRTADLCSDGIRNVLKPWDLPRGQHQDGESS